MSYNSIHRRDLFCDQVVVITGAGSGIGRCTAHELASLGSHVAIVGRNEAKLERVRCEIESDGGSSSTRVADIRDEHAVIATVEQVLTDHGRIDGLVNNAGGQYRAPMTTISTKGFEAALLMGDHANRAGASARVGYWLRAARIAGSEDRWNPVERDVVLGRLQIPPSTAAGSESALGLGLVIAGAAAAVAMFLPFVEPAGPIAEVRKTTRLSSTEIGRSSC